MTNFKWFIVHLFMTIMFIFLAVVDLGDEIYAWALFEIVMGIISFLCARHFLLKHLDPMGEP